jgi:hypothetical protein
LIENVPFLATRNSEIVALDRRHVSFRHVARAPSIATIRGGPRERMDSHCVPSVDA